MENGRKLNVMRAEMKFLEKDFKNKLISVFIMHFDVEINLLILLVFFRLLPVKENFLCRQIFKV
jgi:hypothetical protein